MKHTTISLCTVFAAATLTAAPMLLGGCEDVGAADETAKLTTLNFKVTGMHCNGCVSTVRNAIAGIDGVSSCEVSLENESAVVTASDDVADEILAAVTDLNYTIEQQEQ